jgi:hypothetical protein
MTLHRSVLKYDDLLCEVNADTYSEVSDEYETEILDSDTGVATADSLKKWRSCPLIFTSEIETSTVRGRMQ